MVKVFISIFLILVTIPLSCIFFKSNNKYTYIGTSDKKIMKSKNIQHKKVDMKSFVSVTKNF